jgi:hypothetical protein
MILTEQNKLAERVKESEKSYRTFIIYAPVGIAITIWRARFSKLIRSCARCLYTLQELRQKNMQELYLDLTARNTMLHIYQKEKKVQGFVTKTEKYSKWRIYSKINCCAN